MRPVCRVDQIAENSCFGVKIAGEAVLLTRRGDAVAAFDGVCPHQGAPLAEGAAADGLVVCPFHHAVFDLADGVRRHGPGLGDLRRRAVVVSDGVVHVGDAAPAPAATQEAHRPRIAIVGAGAAGLACAVSLRRFGHAGPILLIDGDPAPLYERTDLSKDGLGGAALDGTPPRIEETALDALAIERRFGARVAEIDGAARSIRFEDGARLGYDLCFAAPGAAARRLDLPGAGLPGAETLRSAEDAARSARAAAAGGRCVVIGGGFIGMEAAASLAQAGVETALLVRETAPGAGRFGADIAAMIAEHLRDLGVDLRIGAEPARFEAREGRLGAVRLASGERIETPLALLAVGETRLGGLVGSAEQDGAVRTDPSLRVAPGLWAGGDAAARDGARTRHWRAAEEEGRRAAADMLGLAPPPEPIPFFWTRIGGPPAMVGLHLVGRVDPDLETVDIGSVAENDFTRFHLEDGRVVGAVGSGGRDATGALHLALIRHGTIARGSLAAAGWDPSAL